MSEDRVIRRFSKQFLRECFAYLPETGELLWRHRPVHHFNSALVQRRWNTRFAGKVAGHSYAGDYLGVKLCGVTILAQHVCWVLGTNKYPEDQLDHINGKKADNRLVNLRDVTGFINQKNAKKRKDNTTGVVGVRVQGSGGYAAYVTINGVRESKYFKLFEEAVAWRKQMVAVAGDYGSEHGRLQ